VRRFRSDAIKLVPLKNIKVGHRHRVDWGDLESLAASIKTEGLLQPIGITENLRLVFGERRLRAYKLLGRKRIPARIVWVSSILAGEFAENTMRKDFTISERIAIKESLVRFRHGGDRRSDQAQNFALEKADELARRLGFGNRESARQAALVVEHAAPEVVTAMDAGTIAISVAAQLAPLPTARQREAIKGGRNAISAALREERRERRLGEILRRTREPLDGSLGRFGIILADPPWRFEHPVSLATELETNHFPTMTLDQICALPVADHAADDAILFLWTPASLLAHAVRVIEEWGFNYRTCAIWDKGRIGMGSWFLVQHEMVLLATRGKPPTPMPKERRPSIITAPRGRHSEKPTVLQEMIELWYPRVRKLELFARRRRNGWVSWGLEAPPSEASQAHQPRRGGGRKRASGSRTPRVAVRSS
jgi:N6-adenosine-specific RNA methylase IME4